MYIKASNYTDKIYKMKNLNIIYLIIDIRINKHFNFSQKNKNLLINLRFNWIND